MKEVLDLLLPLIRACEGCKLEAYPDPGTHGNPWTIGYGCTGPDIKQGLLWTQEIANARLIIRAEGAISSALKLAPTLITNHQMAAIADFIYNAGEGRFKASTLHRLILRKRFESASKEFPKWVFGGGRKLPGLVIRRHKEFLLFRQES